MMGVRTQVAHVSTFPPLRCGIATFAADLISSCPNVDHLRYSLHYGDTDGLDASADADVHSEEAVAELGRVISGSGCEVVSLQHEFGIWGGAEGEYIHSFLDSLTKPSLTVLHTTFRRGVRSDAQTAIVLRLLQESTLVVVLTEASRVSTQALAGRRVENLVVVPHGLPDIPYCPPSAIPAGKNGLSIRLVTPGFFREDKGFEVILCAVRELWNRGYDVTYRIVGEPQRQFGGQLQYLATIRNLIEALDLSAIVEIDDRYLSVVEQAAAIQAAHLGVFAYQDASHASSGTVPLVMAMGRPVLCTPFEYAMAKAREGPGVLVAAGFDHRAMADAAERFISLGDHGSLARDVYARTRPWTWPAVGKVFEELYRRCAERTRGPLNLEGAAAG